MVKKDDKVKVKVMSYDVGSRKLSLTMKIGEAPAREPRQDSGGAGPATNGSAPGGAPMQRPRQATQGEAGCLTRPCFARFLGSWSQGEAGCLMGLCLAGVLGSCLLAPSMAMLVVVQKQQAAVCLGKG